MLAHAFFPERGGDMHFDDSEPWTVGGSGKDKVFRLSINRQNYSKTLHDDLGLEKWSISGSFAFLPFQETKIKD